MMIKSLKVIIDKKMVFRQINCSSESSLYEELTEEYEELLGEAESLCEPVLFIEKGTIGPEDTPVLMVLYSIGKNISEASGKAFAEGDYIRGMLLDAMADAALFLLEPQMEPYIRKLCAKYRLGISRRLEAPLDIPMEAQKIIWEKTKAWEFGNIGITEGYMLSPVKSNAFCLVLTEDEDVFFIGHDCGRCERRFDCRMRGGQSC